LYSLNFHSPRKPRVPILNESTGGTFGEEANSADAWRIVPSPPKVDIKSTFLLYAKVSPAPGVYTGKERDSWISAAALGSMTSEIDGYVDRMCFANSIREAVISGEFSFLERRTFRGGAGQFKERRS
jgi:hypothetical protein